MRPTKIPFIYRTRRPDAVRSKTTESETPNIRHPGCNSPRAAGAISFAAGVILALTAAGHGESLIKTLRSGEPAGSQLAVEWASIPAPMVRQAEGRNTALPTEHSDSRQYRQLDSDLQNLYDDIMRRVGVPYKELQ
jgi:hypothetical protein